jgi:gas vesicle protein
MGKNGARKIAIGTAVGAVAGFLTGILTAPKSGKETREDIKNAAAKVTIETEKKLKEAHAELSQLIAKAQTEIVEQGSKVKAGLDQAVETAQAAQQKVKEVISAIRSGEADEPELKKAMKDAAAAIEHIKKYLASK